MGDETLSQNTEFETLRVFFAIELDELTRSAAARSARALQCAPDGDAVRWVREESL